MEILIEKTDWKVVNLNMTIDFNQRKKKKLAEKERKFGVHDTIIGIKTC